MQANGRSHRDHVEILQLEGGCLAAMPPEALGAPVPGVDGWTLEHVVRHTAKVHRWVTELLAAGPDAQVDRPALTPGPPRGPACLPAYRQALDDLVAELGRHRPGEPIATFGGSGDVSFWARRQAHETTVHRIDAADAVHAAGGPAPDPLDPLAAADGIDEWARVFLSTRFAQRYGSFPDDLRDRTVHVHGTDPEAEAAGVPAEWLLGLGDDGVRIELAHGKGDVALRGPAADLFLVLWRRRPLASIDVAGDRAVAERLLEVSRF
jgi:uncharacterized protein (TIGR03083 family)